MELAAIALVVLHLMDGTEVTVNTAHITSLHPSTEATRGAPNQLVVKGARCVVGLSNGKFYSVLEECAVVRQAMEKRS